MINMHANANNENTTISAIVWAEVKYEILKLSLVAESMLEEIVYGKMTVEMRAAKISTLFHFKLLKL